MKIKNSVIHSPSCLSKSVCISFFYWTQKNVFWRMLVNKSFRVPLTNIWEISSFVFHIKNQTVFLVHIMEVNGTQNWLVTNILQNMFCISHKEPNSILVHIMEVNGTQNCLVTNILQNMFCVSHKEPNSILVHIMEVNGTQNCLVTNILQNMFCVSHKEPNSILVHIMEVNGTQNCLVTNILQNIFFCVSHKVPNSIFGPYFRSQWDSKLFSYQHSSKYLLLCFT